MAFSAGGNNHGLMSEINVTPMVDVMLVLLIIFMVTAPMMMQGMDVQLPKVDAGTIQADDKEMVVISMNSKGEIYLDEHPVPMKDLRFKIKRVMEVKKANVLYLRADQNIPYGQVAQVMGEVRQSGVNNLGLVTEPEEVKTPGK